MTPPTSPASPRSRRPGARLAALSTTHPRRTLGLLAVLFVVAGILGGPVASLLSGGGFDDPNSETSRASRRLLDATGVPADSSIVVLVRAGEPVRGGAGEAVVQSIATRVRHEDHVAQVLDPYSPANPALISNDGMSAYLVATIAVPRTQGDAVAKGIAGRLEADPRITVGGFLIADKQVGDQVSADLGRAEMVAFPILFLVLVVVLRGVVVALLPVTVGGLSILTTFLGLRIANDVTDISVFAVNLVTGLGLGLALDYGLLIVNRYREEAGRTGYGRDAMVRTLGTAGRTVLFSALTVAAAMGSLLLFPERFLYSMGIGGIIGTPISALIALTFLPAILVVLGPRVERWGWFRLDRDHDGDTRGAWYRLSRFVMRRPVVVAVATAALLVALGTPFLRISFTSVDATVLPHSASARQVSDALATEFPTDTSAPIEGVVSAPPGPASAATLTAYEQQLGGLPTVKEVLPPRYIGGNTWVVDLISAAKPLTAPSQQLVSAVRAVPAPFSTLYTGDAAFFKDLQSSLGAHLPGAVLWVSLTTLVILFVMTGSLLLPIKSVLMNVLSLSAAFGLLVLIFQDGHLTGLLRYEPQGGLESTQPVLLFAIAFGLSTDYGVFLLGRIKEEHDRGLPTTEAVATGMQRTGRIVTAAALLFCIAIGAFSSSSIVFIKELGVGTALAVLIDATVVRALLVPALMALLGAWNWWAPRPLRALYRRLGLARLEAGGVPQPSVGTAA